MAVDGVEVARARQTVAAFHHERARRRDACVPWPGGASGWPARPGSPCAPGTHAGAFAGVRSAGKFASLELWKEEGRRSGSPPQYKAALSGQAEATFSRKEIHSPKPALRAAWPHLSTAVEIGVDIREIPAQRQIRVA